MSVKFTFEGLCAFLPSANIQKGTPLDWMTVFMVDTRSNKLKRRPHDPVVEFRLIDLEGQDPSRTSDLSKVRWNLADTDIFLKVEGSGDPGLLVESGVASGEEPVGKHEIADFCWVPRLEAALSAQEAKTRGLSFDGGKVHKQCLGRIPTGRAVTRIHLDHGFLFVDETVRSQETTTVSQFVPSEERNPLRQAISAKVALSFDRATRVRLIARDFATGSWREARLKGPKLSIAFSNLCASTGLFEEQWGKDDDFELFYLLAGAHRGELVGLPSPVAVRHPPSRKPARGDGGTVFKRCTEAQLSALSDSAQLKTYEAMIEKFRQADPWRSAK